MLVAENDGKLIFADDVTSSRGHFRCPGCQQDVIFRHGNKKIAHFAHTKAATCGFSEGETAEHLRGKKQIYRWAQAKGWQPRLEAYLPTIVQRPDILVEIDGQQVAFEFQCSPLSIERLLDRNAGYHRANIKVWWILGAPYRRRLGSQKVVQFTQLLSGQPCLLFWDTKKGCLTVNQQYCRCSYAGNAQKKQALERQLARLLNEQFRPSTKEVRDLIMTAWQQRGRQLGQCPLVCHDLSPSWPALSYPVLLWRISVILELATFPLFYSWSLEKWRKLLVTCGKDGWLKPGCVGDNYLQQMVITDFTTDLTAAQVVVKQGKEIVLLRRPHWVKQPQAKLIDYVQMKRSA
ncbi:competence protein CoiA [Limosilactobacillus caccae]|uniref:competence protein CoiA n=1 Tax=Limosilactobacillus caccae TaxID=1926284 RepID=UPI0009707EEC|nr:competence protein CoiA family protein [Limosilactobacillus caccae]